MNAVQQHLTDLHACREARTWAGERTALSPARAACVAARSIRANAEEDPERLHRRASVDMPQPGQPAS